MGSWVGLGIVVAQNESECLQISGSWQDLAQGMGIATQWEKKLHNVSCPDFRDPHSMNLVLFVVPKSSLTTNYNNYKVL